MKQLIATIRDNERVAEGFYRMRVESAPLAKEAKPGRFVEVRCGGGYEPLLRRPLGIHRIHDDGIEMLYEVVGTGTEILSTKKAGEALDILGPLGNGFTTDTKGPVVLVAGGVGVAPLMALAEAFAGRRAGLEVFIGAKTKTHILCENEFKKTGAKTFVATEDGSKGQRGLITELLQKRLDDHTATIYACGPTAMLKAVALLARKESLPCQVSLEERMACGVGVCLGCPVKMKASGAYKMVCKDGPVFNAEDIAW